MNSILLKTWLENFENIDYPVLIKKHSIIKFNNTKDFNKYQNFAKENDVNILSKCKEKLTMNICIVLNNFSWTGREYTIIDKNLIKHFCKIKKIKNFNNENIFKIEGFEGIFYLYENCLDLCINELIDKSNDFVNKIALELKQKDTYLSKVNSCNDIFLKKLLN
jgi:hypothetical protein